MGFQDFTEHQYVIERLKGFITQSHVAGTYLFTGPAGIGKYTVARAFAMALNCLEKEGDFCGSCFSCMKIEKNAHPDIHCLDFADDEIPIEAVRELRRQVSLRPYEGKHKIFIIRRAHKLGIASSNALLKTLEEAYGSTVIILITDKPFMLPKTIVSRCHQVKFAAFTRQRLTAILQSDYNVGADLAHYLAYSSEGRIEEAVRLKDTTTIESRDAIINTLALGLGKTKLGDSREEMREYLTGLARWFRDIYLLKAGVNGDEIIHRDRMHDLMRESDRLSFESLDEILSTITTSSALLDRNVNSKLLLAHVEAVI
ncbi:MAG TPA: DNA polymerase III subunit [Candidatus Omnitrophota bacterium]|nr:DNA polymerase III subunit [Candidatus Omnitrophota bacterium]HPT07349.1 DNA polymerase III subunit [Candidatus Omnitrophota bacterium]